MADQEYPYENIRMVDISHDENERYKPKRNIPSPKRKNRKDHSEDIKNDLENIKNEVNANAINKGIDPKLIFKVEYERKITEDDFRRFGCDFLGDLPTEGNAQVIFTDEERLKQFFEKWRLYKEGDLTKKNNPQHMAFFNSIISLKRLEPEDRKGPKLRKKDINVDKKYWVDVELWYSGSKDECEKDQESIRKIVGDNGRITDDYIGDSLHLLRMEVRGDSLGDLLEEERVCQIDIPPKLMSEYYQKLDIDIDELTIEEPDIDLPGICVIDSGILPGHQLIENALVDYDKFREDLDNGIDENGHGTFVAGIAVYGNIEKCIECEKFVPRARLYSGRVTDENSDLGPDDKLYIKQIRNAIIHFYKDYNCRIFNLSLADPDNYYNNQQYQSRWAHVLDNLARKHDLVIVVSTGNINFKHFREELSMEGEEICKQYPSYLYKDQTALLDPATAINCITVGSTSNELKTSRGFINPSDKEKGAFKITIAMKDQPSPFTRTGPGFNNTVKPDFVAYGGNMYYDGESERLISSNYETGIPSLNINFLDDGKIFACNSGTSYSAPYISHLAARVLNYNNNFSNNMVRALLANSAEYIEPSKKLIRNYMEDRQEDLLLYLKSFKNNRDDLPSAVKECIDDSIEKGFINCRNKNKLLKSNELPDNFKDFLSLIPGYDAEFEDYMLRVSGYGFPDIDRALSSSENKVTLYAENSIEIDNFDIYEIPIPDDFIHETGLRKITVSLACSPPVRHTRKDYAGYNMDFELIRGVSLDEILERASNVTKEKKIPDLGGERCDFSPKKSLIKTSTLQKASFKIKRTPKDYGETYYLVVVAEDKWITNSSDFIESTDEENYSVVITLEHEKEKVKMYNQIKQRILERIRVEEQEEVRDSIKV